MLWMAQRLNFNLGVHRLSCRRDARPIVQVARLPARRSGAPGSPGFLRIIVVITLRLMCIAPG